MWKVESTKGSFRLVDGKGEEERIGDARTKGVFCPGIGEGVAVDGGIKPAERGGIGVMWLESRRCASVRSDTNRGMSLDDCGMLSVRRSNVYGP